ncbi:hypothetical protein ACJIZ3_025029 [Penstemon smallii]|uniref:Uncharacterized protein n=1 Tax=Penstemon smallii TaxID=265156 RepID=A0ABD3TWT2_9LAMI
MVGAPVSFFANQSQAPVSGTTNMQMYATPNAPISILLPYNGQGPPAPASAPSHYMPASSTAPLNTSYPPNLFPPNINPPPAFPPCSTASASPYVPPPSTAAYPYSAYPQAGYPPQPNNPQAPTAYYPPQGQSTYPPPPTSTYPQVNHTNQAPNYMGNIYPTQPSNSGVYPPRY